MYRGFLSAASAAALHGWRKLACRPLMAWRACQQQVQVLPEDDGDIFVQACTARGRFMTTEEGDSLVPGTLLEEALGPRAD